MEQKARTPATFQLDTKPHVLIVEARFYWDIATLQLQGAKAVLDRAGATYDTLIVPGALEIPAAIVYAIRGLDFDPTRRRYDAYVALGCVLKGGTMHDEIVGSESARGLQEIAARHVLAIGNGILTCDTHAQALERADPSKLDRAGAAAEAALRMFEIKQGYNLIPKRRWVGVRKV